MLKYLKNCKLLRWPLITICKILLCFLNSKIPLIRRAVYDTMPVPYIVTGDEEIFIISTSDKVIGREIFLHDQFDFDKLKLAIAILSREGLAVPRHLIDVGANIGSIVVPAVRRGYFQSATAIEPHPENLKLLRANLALNNLCDAVNVLGVAVGDESGITLRLSESKHNSGNHSIGGDGLEVKSICLNELDIPLKDSLLWMDIEGYEGHALAGASKLICGGMPFVSEFNIEFIKNMGGLEYFYKAVENKRIFELNGDGREIKVDDLFSAEWGKGEYTDILAISK